MRECIGEEGHKLFLEEDTEETTGERPVTFGGIQEGIEEIDSESGALGQGNILSSTESDDETIDDDIDDGSLYSQ